MTKKRTILFSLVMAILPLSNSVYADPLDIDLQVGYVDPSDEEGNHRSLALTPHIGIEDNILFFYTPCDGCELRIVGTNNTVEYSTIISFGTTSLVLPSYLSGTYEIQIIQGNLCFWGYLDL